MPDPFVGWFAKEILLQEAFSRALDRLGRRSWRWRLTRRARRQTRTWIAGWRLRRWLGRQATWDALVHPSPEHAERLVATLAAAARPRVVLLRPTRYTQEALRGEATRVAAATAEQFIAALEAPQAVAVVDRRHQLHDERAGRQHEQLSAQLAAGQQALLKRLDAEHDFDERLARLPPTVREPLQLLNELDHAAAVRLTGWLTVPAGTAADSARSVHELTTDPPPQLLAAPPIAWAALAAYAHSHELPTEASALFERAAEQGAPDRARWLAMAAYAAINQDQPRAQALVVRARAQAAGRHLVVEAVGWTLERADGRLAALEAEVGSAGGLLDQPLVAHLVAEAHVRRQQLGRAISLYARLLKRHPERAGVALRLAQLLAGRSMLGLGGRRSADLRDARQAATRALELHRRFGTDARQTLAYACELALVDSDHAEALRLGLPLPRGTATPAEAADPSVLRHTAAAAMQLGEVTLAQELAGRLLGSFDRALLTAQLLHQGGHGDEARAAYERAWPLAETVVDQRDVQLGLAELGVWPLPGHEELERDPDEFAVYILAQSEATRGDPAAAVRRLRPWQARSQHCAELLARLYETAGEVDEAVAALQDAGLRTGTPSLLVHAAEVLFVHERDTDLERLAARALAHTREGTNERLRLLLLLVAAAQRRHAWPSMAERARALLEEDPADPQARWLLVTALYNQRLAEPAWQVLSEAGELVPRTPGEALAWLQLHGRFQPGIAWFKAGLELAAEHADQEQECAGILAELSQIRLDPAPPAELGARLHAAREAFLARYPTSPWLWMLPVGTTAAEHVQALRPLLQPEAAVRATATEQVIAGRASYGVLAVTASRPYALALLSCAAGCLPCYPAEAAVADVERAAARAALDGHLVTDASVLHLASHLQDRWPLLCGCFAGVRLPVAAAEDLAHTEAALLRPPDGMISWDLARDIPVITTPDPARYAVLGERAAWMHRVARELRPLDWPKLSGRFDLPDQAPAPHGDPATDPLLLAWLGPVDCAAERGVPLWSDDLVLRMLARQQGVAAFGTLALLEVLVEDDRVATSALDDIVLCLRRAWFVDLPDLPGHLEALAEEAGFAPGPAVLAFARAVLWRPIDQGLARYLALCTRVAAADPLLLGPWLHAAILGAAAAWPAVNHQQLAEMLLARTAAGAMQPPVLACLVAAARAATGRLGIGDPLPGAIRRLVDAAVATVGLADALRAVLKLCADLEPTDQELARRAAFGSATDVP